jgi:2-oxo-3-hexenedioate decarboxylase
VLHSCNVTNARRSRFFPIGNSLDTVAAKGVHGALLTGPRHKIGSQVAEWGKVLSAFEIDLLCDGRVIDAADPKTFSADPIPHYATLSTCWARDEANPPLAAGEIVTTGTLTRAMPVRSGETWSTALEGISLAGIQVRFDQCPQEGIFTTAR